MSGLWHDLGKRRPGLQRYIRAAGGPEAHIEGHIADRDKTHSAAGAPWAEQYMTEAFGREGRLLNRLIQYAIAGHHAGLADRSGSQASLSSRPTNDAAVAERDESLARPSPIDILRPDLSAVDPTAFRQLFKLGNEHAHALFDRVLVAPTRGAATPAREFGAYSITFDGKALSVGQTLEAAPGVKLYRRC